MRLRTYQILKSLREKSELTPTERLYYQALAKIYWKQFSKNYGKSKRKVF
jgi:hypothetical protein